MTLSVRNTLLMYLGAGLLFSAAGWAGEAGPKHNPKDILLRLKRGNAAYVSGKLSAGGAAPARRVSLVPAQHPYAVVLTCADSRVPPEYIFNEGLGSLFVVRVAGGVADPVTVGSVEYGVEHLKAPLVVVMGHTRCGAVKAAMETPAPVGRPSREAANIESILELVRPGIQKSPPKADPWTTAVYGGVEQTVSDLFRISRIVPEMMKAGEVGVVGAVYDIETGKVAFSERVPLDKTTSATEFSRLLEWKAVTSVASAHKR